MNLKALLTVLFVAILFSSCSHIYEPALYHADVVYQPKPASWDSVKAKTYISAGFSENSNTNGNDDLQSGQLEVSRGYVFDHFNLAFGGFGVLGDYNNTTQSSGDPNYFSDKTFGALGGRASINLYEKMGNVDFRALGAEMVYSHEFGDYAVFRKNLYAQQTGGVDPRTDLFTAGLTTEVIFHGRNNKKIEHGLRGFMGATFGNSYISKDQYDNQNSSQTVFFRFAYFFNFDNYFATAEIGNGIFFRLGYKF